MSKQPTTSITFSVPDILAKKIKDEADSEGRSISGWLRFHIGESLKMSDSDTALEDEIPEPLTPEPELS